MRQFIFLMLAETNIFLANAISRVPGKALVDPLLMPFFIRSRQDKELDLHLLEFPRPKSEVAGRDLIAKGFADLRNAEREFLARCLQNVVEIYEDSLGRFRSQVCPCT